MKEVWVGQWKRKPDNFRFYIICKAPSTWEETVQETVTVACDTVYHQSTEQANRVQNVGLERHQRSH